jgi:hypothetical protein
MGFLHFRSTALGPLLGEFVRTFQSAQHHKKKGGFSALHYGRDHEYSTTGYTVYIALERRVLALVGVSGLLKNVVHTSLIM